MALLALTTGLALAIYPDGHFDRVTKCTTSNFEGLVKEKVDAGAGLIITQLFYDCDIFLKFVRDCRQAGIQVPILPGLMPIQSYGGFKRMTGFCKTRIPPDMMLELDRLKGDDCKEAFIEFGVQWVTNMCQKIVASKKYPGLHFYCLNASERTYQIMERLGYLRPS